MFDLRRIARLASALVALSLLGGSVGIAAAAPTGAGRVHVTTRRTLKLLGTSPTLTTLAFTDTETGYAGGRGVLLMTRDGGRTWQDVWHGEGTVTQVDAVSADVADAVTTRGLLGTTDGGRHWESLREPSGGADCLAIPVAPCLAAVSFAASGPDVGYGVAAPSPLVGTDPSGVLVAPSGSMLFVANGQSGPSDPSGTGTGTVTAYDLASGRIVWDVPVGEFPASMAVSRHGTYLYVADQGSDTVTVIDTSTGRVADTVPTAAGPCGIAVDPADGDVFVSWEPLGSSQSSAMEVLSPGPRSRVLGPVAGALPGCSLAFAPGGKALYVTGQANAVQVVDPASRKVIGTFAVAGSPSGVAVSPDGRALYVATTLNASTTGKILDLRPSTGRTVRTWRTGPFPTTVTVDAATGAIVVASGSSVHLIDPATGATRRVSFTTHVTAGEQMSLSPDGRTLFVPTGTGVTAVTLPGMATRALETSGTGVSSVFGTPALETGGTLVRTTDGGRAWEPVPGAPPVQTACALASGGVVAVSGLRVFASARSGAALHPVFRAPLQAWPGIFPTALCRGSDVAIEWTASNAAMEHAPYILFNSSDGGRTFRPVAEENYTHIGLPGVNAPEGPGTEPGPFTLTPAGHPVLTAVNPAVGAVGIRPPDAAPGVSLTIPGAGNVLAVAFPAEQVGDVLTTQGRILATADGGHHFTQLWPSGPAPLDAIAFPTATIGYGLGTGGDARAVLRTVDGGRDWTRVSNLPGAPNPYGGQELAFVNANLGYAASAAGVLYRTTNGGRTWTVAQPASYFQLAFDGSDGCAETGSGFATSRDGGRTWHDESGPVPLSLTGCADALAAPRWSDQETAFGSGATLVGAVGADDAWFLENDRLYRTTNGGRTYEELAQEALGTTAVPAMFAFPPVPTAPGPQAGRVGYLLTQSGELYRTTDGGQVWTEEIPPG